LQAATDSPVTAWETLQRQIQFGQRLIDGLTFGLFLAINATLFLRPAEIVPVLKGLPIYEFLVVGATLGSLGRMQRRLSWQALIRQPASICVAGLLAAVVMSHATHVSWWWLQESVPHFAKVLVYYFLLVSIVDSPGRMRKLLLTIVVCGTAMVALCVIDFVGFHDLQFIEHVVDRDSALTDSGEETFVLRMRGTGVFQDPNDISLVIVIMSVLCAYFMTDPRGSPLRAGWLIPLAVLAAALFFTKSRGGLLAEGAAVLTYLAYRHGRTTALACAACGLLALPFVSGRQGNIDLEEGGTGHERIVIWKDGLEEIKNANLVFGIGQGMFDENIGIAAHNSYLHTFVELGLFGGTLFLGCFTFTALALYRLRPDCDSALDPELARFAPFLAALTAGWCAGLFTLSRCYVVPTYLIVGLGAAYTTLMNGQLRPPRFLVVWDRLHVQKLLAGSAAVFVGLHVFVKLFGT
jgi:hypothetical protein